ncbi:MAG: shikimate kinase [Pyrinomonadaceae bacterium]
MNDNGNLRIALTGFMGVGKSSVARHLSHLLRCRRLDLDLLIEERAGRTIAELIDSIGIDEFRLVESEVLAGVVAEPGPCILSLGGGTWTVEANRLAIRSAGYRSIWLESSFEHCWYNIRSSRKERPLARSKHDARRLFDERQRVYCLADSHFIVRPEFTSFEIARQIVEELG